MYRKLKRVWSHNDANYIPKFREIFPELNKISSEEMCDRWIELGVDFYTVIGGAVKLTEGQIAAQIEQDDDEDAMWDDDDFECCDNCDLPDACADFGCAIKAGIKKDTGW